MAGFLDKNERVIDMVLTSHGRSMLSKGQLGFRYFALFDDEVDYTPFVAESGSLSSVQLSSSIDAAIESAPVLEATTGYRTGNPTDTNYTSVHRPLFSVPQGRKVLPRVSTGSFEEGTMTLEVKHRKVQDLHVKTDGAGNTLQVFGPYDRGYERYDSTVTAIRLSYKNYDVDPSRVEGFLVRVYQSSSEGMIELAEKRDSENNVAYSSDIRLDFLLGGGVTKLGT